MSTPSEQSKERIDPVEACKKHVDKVVPRIDDERARFRIMELSARSDPVSRLAALAVKCERLERENAKLRETVRDREAELLRCRTHENVAAVTLDRQLNPEQRDALKVACDELAKLRAVVDRLPKTADGVPITPGMDVYRRDHDMGEPTAVEMFVTRIGDRQHPIVYCIDPTDDDNGAFKPSDLWSSVDAIRAALAAAEKE